MLRATPRFFKDNFRIAGVLIAFLIATLAVAGLVTYLIGSLSFGAVLAVWVITTILVTIAARLLATFL